MPSARSEHRFFLAMLALAGGIYLVWWFAVRAILPQAFNPLASRLVVVGYFLAALALVSAVASLRRHADRFYYAGAILLTIHYFYLVLHNTGDFNWIVGAYLVVLVVSIGISSRAWLIGYSALVLALGVGVWGLAPPLHQTIFLPGLATIVCLCLVVLLSRMRLLESLAESTSRFESLFDAGFEGVVIHDDGLILDVNQAFAALVGYRRDELIGMDVRQLAEPTAWAAMRERQGSDLPQRYESSGLRRDGTAVPVEVSSKAHVYRGRRVRLAAVRDISELRRAEAERLELFREQAARVAAQGAIRIREEFMAIASHELRTPLTSLQLQLEGLVRALRKLPLMPEAQHRVEAYHARSVRQMGRLNRLIQQLLDVSRLTSGDLTLSPEPVTLGEIVREAVDGLTEDLERAACTVEIQEGAPILGLWDRLRVEQVLTNLLRNALLYGSGKPIEIGLSAAGDHATFFVRDRGFGIAKESQAKIFERFERAVSARNYGGLGLGLYITKQIIEAHLGSIRVESEPGYGSTFWVELPLRPAITAS